MRVENNICRYYLDIGNKERSSDTENVNLGNGAQSASSEDWPSDVWEEVMRKISVAVKWQRKSLQISSNLLRMHREGSDRR